MEKARNCCCFAGKNVENVKLGLLAECHQTFLNWGPIFRKYNAFGVIGIALLRIEILTEEKGWDLQFAFDPFVANFSQKPKFGIALREGLEFSKKGGLDPGPKGVSNL